MRPLNIPGTWKEREIYYGLANMLSTERGNSVASKGTGGQLARLGAAAHPNLLLTSGPLVTCDVLSVVGVRGL